MVGSSSSSQVTTMSIDSGTTTFIKPRTMAISKDGLSLIIEHALDINSLRINGCDILQFIEH